MTQITIYTAGAVSHWSYLVAAVAATSAEEAERALRTFFDSEFQEEFAAQTENSKALRDFLDSEFVAMDDVDPKYEMDDVKARIPDEDGCYPNDDSDSYDLDCRPRVVAEALAHPGRVVVLDAGRNG